MKHHTAFFNQMVDVMSNFYPVTPAFVIRLRELIRFIDYKAGDIILDFKGIQDYALFQVTGISVELSKDPDTLQEMISWFWYKDDFLYTTPGFFSQQPTNDAIQVITDSTFICISFSDFSALAMEFAETKELAENLRDHYKIQYRSHHEGVGVTAINRVKKLHHTHPEVFDLCSRKQLAGFLKMTPDTLTRMMNKLGIPIR